jgi:hypothetical protein
MHEITLEGLAAFVAIAGAIVTVFVFSVRLIRRRHRRHRLEQYLKDEKGVGFDQGQRTVPHLMAGLGMLEREVLEAAFSSKVVRRVTLVDDRGFAADLLLEYDDDTSEFRSTGRRRF